MFVVLVERDQRAITSCHPRVSGQRPVLRARQFEPSLGLGQRHSSTPQHQRHKRQGSSIPWRSRSLYPSGCRFHEHAAPADCRIVRQEDVNFLLTNRIPRRLATRFLGWFSQIEHPLVRDLSIGVWRLFADLDLSEAREQAVPQPARLFHPAAEGRCTPDRSRSGHPGQPLRRHRRCLRAGAGTAGDSDQGLSLPAAGSARRARIGRALS